MLKTNYHTHTRRCKHASVEVIDYCRAARDAELDILGVSDHTPFPDGRWDYVRMSMDELPVYGEELAAARVEVPEVQIIGGLECEYVEEYCGFDSLVQH